MYCLSLCVFRRQLTRTTQHLMIQFLGDTTQVAILFPPAAAAFITGCSCDLLINILLTMYVLVSKLCSNLFGVGLLTTNPSQLGLYSGTFGSSFTCVSYLGIATKYNNYIACILVDLQEDEGGGDLWSRWIQM